MNPDDMARIAQLLQLTAGTVALFSDTKGGDGRISRVTELSHQIAAIAAELTAIADKRKNELRE